MNVELADPALACGGLCALPGERQTVPKAELYAGLLVLRHSEPTRQGIAIFADCKYFVHGASLTNQRSRLRLCRGRNGGQWHAWWQEVIRRRGRVAVLKTAAHASDHYVWSGRVGWW